MRKNLRASMCKARCNSVLAVSIEDFVAEEYRRKIFFEVVMLIERTELILGNRYWATTD
jgi:hypothetical protein